MVIAGRWKSFKWRHKRPMGEPFLFVFESAGPGNCHGRRPHRPIWEKKCCWRPCSADKSFPPKWLDDDQVKRGGKSLMDKSVRGK